MSVDATVSNIVEMYSVYAFYCASVVKCRSYSSVQQRSSDNNNSDNDLISVRHTNFVANLAELHRQNRAEIWMQHTNDKVICWQSENELMCCKAQSEFSPFTSAAQCRCIGFGMHPATKDQRMHIKYYVYSLIQQFSLNAQLYIQYYLCVYVYMCVPRLTDADASSTRSIANERQNHTCHSRNRFGSVHATWTTQTNQQKKEHKNNVHYLWMLVARLVVNLIS